LGLQLAGDFDEIADDSIQKRGVAHNGNSVKEASNKAAKRP
jgi:hypothetical protein